MAFDQRSAFSYLSDIRAKACIVNELYSYGREKVWREFSHFWDKQDIRNYIQQKEDGHSAIIQLALYSALLI